MAKIQLLNIFSVKLLLVVIFSGCSEPKQKTKNGLKTFVVEGVHTPYNLKFELPETFISVRDVKDLDKLDTTDIALNWIFYMQYENPDFFCFYDSLDTNFNILVKAGPRVDISRGERKMTFFTVPTTSLERIFPPESDSLKIIYDSGEKKHHEKTYYKRKYKGVPDIGTRSEYYYVSTKWQSVIIIVNSPKDVDMDGSLLTYEVNPKSE